MKKINELTLMDFKFISQPAYSPDGKYISVAVKTADYEGNCYHSDLYVLDEDRKEKKITSEGNVGTCTWTPEGTLVYAAEGTKGANGNLCLYEVCPKEAAPKMKCELASAIVSKLSYVGDGKYCYVGEVRVPEVQDPYLTPLEDKEAVYYTFDELPMFKENQGTQSGKRNALFVLDAKTGESTMVSTYEQQVVTVSNDGKTILYTACGYSENLIKDEDVSIYTYEIATGKTVKVMDKTALKLRNCEVFGRLWNGKVLVFGSKGEKYGYVQSPDAWLIDRETLEMTKFFDFKGSNMAYRNAITDCDNNDGQMKVIGDKVYFTNTRDHNTYLRFFGADGEWSEDLTPEGSCDGFDICGDNMLYTGFYGNKLSEVYENGKQITHFNDHIQTEYSVSTPEHMEFIDSDGVRIDGWVMKPVDYKEGTKYPVILDIHGGPRYAYGPIFMHEHQMWANDGYFVFFCNPRGGEGRDDEFANCWGENMGVVDYNDIMEFVNEALKLYPDADAEKMGVTGGSYGGYMTNWIIGHTDRFAAACAQRSICNWTSMELGTPGIGYYWVKNFLKCTTAEDADFLWEKSPLKHAYNAKTPTLFIHAKQDNCCWQDQAIQMYTALKLNNVPAKFCFFEHEGHELSRSGKPHGRIARLVEMHQWMDKYLK